jgi:uncharacterized protein YodC (DUF2158 family)
LSVDPEKLRVGDVVRVNNIPGPRMVVTGFAQPERGKPEPVANVHCKWFDKRAVWDGTWFPARLLHKVAPWTERPGYRMALEALHEMALRHEFGDLPIMPNGLTIEAYIADVIAHRSPQTATAVEPLEQVELAEAE